MIAKAINFTGSMQSLGVRRANTGQIPVGARQIMAKVVAVRGGSIRIQGDTISINSLQATGGVGGNNNGGVSGGTLSYLCCTLINEFNSVLFSLVVFRSAV